MTEKNEKEIVKASEERDAKEIKAQMMVNSLSTSLSSIDLMRDYIEMVQIQYDSNKDRTRNSGTTITLFERGGLNHLDLALSDIRDSLDLVLCEMFEYTEK